MPTPQQRKKNKPGEPRKNGTGGSFASVDPDSDQGVDLAAVVRVDDQDIDLIAARDGWTPSDWERHHDERHAAGESGDTCSECGAPAYGDLDELCRDCALATGDYTEDDLPLDGPEAEAAPSRGYELLRQAWLPANPIDGVHDHAELYLADAGATLDINPADAEQTWTQTNSDWAKIKLRSVQPGGYDEVRIQAPKGERVFFYSGPYFSRQYGVAAHELHRLDGPAEVHEDGAGVAWIEGKRVSCPVPGDYTFKSAEPNGDGYDKLWAAGDGSYLWESADGGLQYADSTHATHRIGAPARIDANGDERWYLHGIEYPDPRPVPPVEETVLGPEGQPVADVRGGKFDADLPLEEVSIRVLAEMKNAADLGWLPEDSTPRVRVNMENRSVTLRLHDAGRADASTRESWRLRAIGLAAQHNAWSRGAARPAHFVTNVEID